MRRDFHKPSSAFSKLLNNYFIAGILLFILINAISISAFSQLGLLQTNNMLTENKVIRYTPPQFKIITKFNNEIEPINKLESLSQTSSGNNIINKLFQSSQKGQLQVLRDSLSLMQQRVTEIRKQIANVDFKINAFYVNFEDTSLSVKSYPALIESLSSAYGDFEMMLSKKDDYTKRAQDIITESNKLKTDIENISPDLSNDEINIYNTLYENRRTPIFRIMRSIFSEINTDTSILNQHVKTYNKIIADFFNKKANPVPVPKPFGALPQVTKILGERETVAGLQFLGRAIISRDSTKTCLAAEMGILFAAQNEPDKPNLKTLFVDQASTFHLFTHFNYAFVPYNVKGQEIKRLAINLHASYSTKKILLDTIKISKTINPSLFHTQTGLEFLLLPGGLSIYGNVNTLSIFDKVAEFKSALSIERKFFGYVDCGAKLFLIPDASLGIKNAGIFVNANFIINSGDVKYVTKSEDTVIPNIQIGIQASF